MKIRSITYFLNPRWPLDESALDAAGEFVAAARPAYEDAGYEVQTARLATIPFPHLLPHGDMMELLDLAPKLEARAAERGYEYISLGPALPEFPESFKVIPEILQVTENVFLCGVMASQVGGISLSALRACARVIQRAAPLEADGFANLRFAALANVPPGAPFFPAAYHSGGPPTFALATEAADLAVEAFSSASSLGEAQRSLVEVVENHAQSISRVSVDLASRFKLPFGGIDFSLAPFPKESLSIGTALERLGVPAVGMHGSLAAAAVVTEALERAEFPRAGFSGLFLPLMEDVVLTERAQEGLLSLEDILLYSAVCGTGLDTIPLPGDVSPEAMSAVLLDLSALALRLDKPLTARLMPIPGKAAGDPHRIRLLLFRQRAGDGDPIRAAERSASWGRDDRVGADQEESQAETGVIIRERLQNTSGFTIRTGR